VTVSAREESGTTLIAVSDTGIGIPGEDQARIFEEFVRLSPGQEADLEGAGLGLALSSRLAQLVGGSIEVRSVPEEGSTFTLRLPASESPPKRAALPSAEGPIGPVRPAVSLFDPGNQAQWP
jgi:signal transduction histidine kinase